MTETKVRVRLDTRQAKSEMSGLKREGEKTSAKLSSSLRSAVSSGFSAVGLGCGIKLGVTAVRSATQSGFGDVISESLGGIGAQLADFFLGDLDEKSKASRAAREETIQAFGAITGARGGAIPPGALQFYESVRSLRLQEEQGRDVIERDERFRGPGIGDMIDRIMTKVGELISQAVDELASRLNPFD